MHLRRIIQTLPPVKKFCTVSKHPVSTYRMGFLEDAIGSISGGDSNSDDKPKEQDSEEKTPARNHSWHWGGGNQEEEGGKGSFGSFFSSFNSDNSSEHDNAEVKEDANDTADDNTDEKKKAAAAATSKKQNQWNSLFSSLMSNSDKDNDDGGNDAMGSILDSWIDKKDKDDDVSQGKSITEYRSMFKLYEKEVKRVSEIYFGDIEIQNLSPASIFYFIEREEGKKTPSWKCRKHRFHQNLKRLSSEIHQNSLSQFIWHFCRAKMGLVDISPSCVPLNQP